MIAIFRERYAARTSVNSSTPPILPIVGFLNLQIHLDGQEFRHTQNFFEFAGSLIMTKATVTIPLIAVNGIVIRSIRINANALPTNPNFLASRRLT